MRQSLTAAAAALSAIFVSTTDIQAQQAPAMQCGPTERMAAGLKQYGETLTAIGKFQGVKGLFADKFERISTVEPSKLSGYFQIYSNKETGGWTAITTTENGVSSCIVMHGDNLQIASEYDRAPGLPVSLAPRQSPLEKKEYELIWSKNGGQGLQLTADSRDGELRVYANTGTGSFTIIRHNPENGAVQELTGGILFPALSSVEATRTRLEAAQAAARPESAAPVVPGSSAPEVSQP